MLENTSIPINIGDAEARCLRKIETQGAVECGVPSVARALPTCPEGFNFM